MKVLILSGGSGTRLFPISRDKFPKQFLKIFGGESLLQRAVERAVCLAGSLDSVVFVSNKDYLYHIKDQVEEILHTFPKHLVLESVKRNTAPATVLGISYMLERGMLKEDEPVLVMPSDHVVSPIGRFVERVKSSEAIAKEGYIVIFGVKPTRPETGYGYVEMDGTCVHSGYRVKRFHEKPNLERAKEYISTGNFFWNSGMFCFTPKTLFSELKAYCQDIYSQVEGRSFEQILENFHNLPDISLDYAVMEKTQRAVVIPLDVEWSDVGCFDSIYEIMEKDTANNGIYGEVIAVDSERNLIITTGKPVATIGISDSIVINTEDIIVVVKSGESQKVGELYKLIRSKRKELTEYYTKQEYEPWGVADLLYSGNGLKVKRLSLFSGEKLISQVDEGSREYFVVLKGDGKVSFGAEEKHVKEGDSVFLTENTQYEVQNLGEGHLELIQVRFERFLGERKSVKLDDFCNAE
ncbi:MAG: mannose-1-phosphate guanylyltransferase/mannose-6-phosphate isomerase [Thermodesulfovibrio sp.]|nr:mannose-1-phosphate guanylyltransferase/mannose-6-phosphate isomerase [Thermodesulfovibrio sp.]